MNRRTRFLVFILFALLSGVSMVEPAALVAAFFYAASTLALVIVAYSLSAVLIGPPESAPRRRALRMMAARW